MSRIDILPEDAKNLIQICSVVGREVRHELIEKVMELSENELLNRLSVLKDSELLYERGIYPQSAYIFKHALTQEVVYNGLLKKERREIHEQIALVMESLFQDRVAEFYETLAFHFARGRSGTKAIDYLVKRTPFGSKHK